MRRGSRQPDLATWRQAYTLPWLIAAFSCGGDGGKSWVPAPQNKVPQARLMTPEVANVTPTQIHAGQKLTIVGQRFADPEVGTIRIAFHGSFQSSAGGSYPVSFESRATAENQGILSWHVAPNIPFSPQNEMGTFDGRIEVVNVGHDGTEMPAAPLEVHLRVGPSIIVEALRPATTGCHIGINGTTEETPIFVQVRAIGLSTAAGSPLRFFYTFISDQFRFTGYLANERATNPDSLFPSQGAVTVVDVVDRGTVSRLDGRTGRDVYIARGAVDQVLQDFYVSGAGWLFDKEFGLVELQTAPIGDPAADSQEATIGIVAIDAQGNEARRILPMKVWRPVEIEYQGQSEVIETWDPIPVSGCMFGGNIGRMVDYNESVADQRARSYSTSGGLDISAKAGGNFVASLDSKFGFSVTANVSSTESQALRFSPERLLPNNWGVYYRQTQKLHRKARLVQHGACGDAIPIGEVTVTDWTWSPDFSQRTGNCPPYPKSNLQPAWRKPGT